MKKSACTHCAKSPLHSIFDSLYRNPEQPLNPCCCAYSQNDCVYLNESVGMSGPVQGREQKVIIQRPDSSSSFIVSFF